MTETPTPHPVAALVGPRTTAAVKLSLKITSIALVVVLIVAVALAAWLAGEPGLKAVGLAAAAGVAILLVTIATHLFTIKNPDLMMAGMGADFILKLVVILVTLAIARKLEGLDAMTIFLTMLAIILVQTITFPVAITRARVPLLDPPETAETTGEIKR